MSVYNHRPVVPPAPSRIAELLDAIKGEFDQLTQDAIACRSQRDEYEHKMNSQIQEMNAFQASLYELERTQQNVKKQYEEEISRLRQQLDQARAGHPPLSSGSVPPAQQSHPSQQHSQPAPPNIGPASNLFGGIMNSQGNTQGPPGLVAPPQMVDPNQQQGGQQHMGYPNSPQPPSSYPNGPSPQNGPPPQQQGSQPLMPVGRPISGASKMSGGPTGGNATPNGPSPMVDVDPESVPSSLKNEGSDWIALFNPKAQRLLKVDLVHNFEHPSVVCCVKFSMDGRYFAAGCNRATYIYDVATSQRVCVLQDDNVGKENDDLYIRSVCFSPDGKFIATGAEDKQIRIWDISKRRIRHCLTGHEQDIYSLDFSRDGRIIVSGSGDRTARIWDMAEGVCLHVLRVNDIDQKDPGVTSVAISPDGRLVAAGSLDKMVRVWDTQTGQMLERFEGHKDSVYSVAFMADGKSVVSGSLDKTLRLWQLNTDSRGYGNERGKGPCKQIFTGHKDFVLSVATTPDGNWVVSGSKDRRVQFWDPRTGQVQFMLQGHKNSVISVTTSPSGRPLFASGSGDNLARIWSYEPI
ncbi:hypothetical protein K450DRAFT_261385 [Umbelopsis ramanniana AG]|uniref:Transcriptional repressor Tup1 N-terminal domain-containing protein n=1 Tax=Umbelopsis ramanniana AG TaxID=1314678 RepID=A0AAD5HA97_UMBRA|nr:uncharacterized protein K450DRAFT_261385 [Umbelopsis ramanniana AG]KAI8575534.1 hypothetical protein K450DRAFT_261385 [Umbelopsis ramanniana AG]